MEKLLIRGGNSLSGEIRCSGAKNAALPMIAATILTENEVTLKNLPFLQDITTMFELLGSMGSKITLDEEMNFQISSSLSDFEDISSISSASLSRSIITSPESPFPEKLPFESDVLIVK